MKFLGYILILLVVIFGVSFAILNASPVTIHYYLGTSSMPLSLLLVTGFAVGFVLGLILMGFSIIRLKAQNRSLRKKILLVEKEIENLRAIPIKDEH